MPAVFLRSLGLYLSWFVRSLLPGRHPGAPLSLRRILLLLLGMPLFIALQLAHWLGFLIDEICFRGYRKVKIQAPLFITGIPRSGTTYLHRTLAAKRSAYCTVSTWEAALAPSVTERKLLAALRSIDRAVGSPLHRAVNRLLGKASGDFNDIHEVGIGAAEEDYLWLLPAGSCFILSMAFPFSPWLASTTAPGEMPGQKREQLLDYYVKCIQRHLYHHGSGRRFLSKNAAFAGWIGPLARRFPDARFLVCVRHPMSALSSQLSSLHPARKLFATDPDGSQTKERMTDVFASNYQHLEKLTRQMPDDRMAIIDQADLRTHEQAVLSGAFQRLSLPPEEKLDKPVANSKSPSGSPHRHSASEQGLENKKIEVCLLPPYQAIMQSTQRVRPPTQEHGTSP